MGSSLTDRNRSLLAENKQKNCCLRFLEPRKKPLENSNDPLGDMEMANVLARKQQQQRIATRITSSSSEVNSLFLLSSSSFPFFSFH